MLAFIASPIVVLAVLVYGIIISLERGPSMMAEPVGAGAGDAGGANALGELLFGSGEVGRGIPAEQTARGALIVVRDETGLAGAQRPIYLLTNHDGWEVHEPMRLRPRDDGAWEIAAPVPEDGATEALAFRFVLGDTGLGEIDPSGEPVGPRRLPRIREADAEGEGPFVYEFILRGFESE